MPIGADAVSRASKVVTSVNLTDGTTDYHQGHDGSPCFDLALMITVHVSQLVAFQVYSLKMSVLMPSLALIEAYRSLISSSILLTVLKEADQAIATRMAGANWREHCCL